MKKFTSCICSKANGLALRARMALSNQRGDFYISDAVKSSSPLCWAPCCWRP